MLIQTLPQDVVNQIAAGEVVERPAHLVKELIENSLDAGADVIEVKFETANLNLVIKDNGVGMSQDDLRLSISPHATSKIAQFTDLQKLTSYGFRGEALASISSVASLEILSRQKGASQGFQLTSKPSNQVSVAPVTMEPGTEIRVTELFVNVPARLKFLKSLSAEHSQIINVIKAFALVRPNVEFKIIKNQNLLCFWPKVSEWTSRVEAVLEAAPFFESSLEVDGLKVRVAFLPPSQVFKTSKNIWLFAQKRWIQDKSLQFAVMEGYRSTLMTKEFPAVVVDLECAPEMIDVNVHPSKSQVRFSSNVDPFRAIRRCLAQAITQNPTETSGVSASQEPPISLASIVRDYPQPQEQNLTLDVLRETFYNKRSDEVSSVTVNAANQSTFNSEVNRDEDPLYAFAQSSPTTVVQKKSWSDLDIVGQVHLTYLVCQTEDSMVIVDQHAAHERVLYDKFIKGWKSNEIAVQSFLFPLTFDVSEAQVELFLANRNEVAKLGFELDQGGPQTILVRAAPSGVSEASVVKALQNMALELEDIGQTSSFEDLVTHTCATMACHSAVRAGQAMSIDQIKSLLMQMDQVELADYCPHGRPVSIEFSRSSIEKKFGRID
jgi:DNA mismatch repair protein MutL